MSTQPDRSRSDPYHLATQGAHVWQAVIVIATTIPVWIVPVFFHGVWRALAFLIVAGAVGALAARSFRLSLDVTDDQIAIRNFWRDYHFSWAEVTGIGPGVIGMRRAVAFVLDGGKVRKAQATAYNVDDRSHAIEVLRFMAPKRVKFIQSNDDFGA
jgi:hypothetical protein